MHPVHPPRRRYRSFRPEGGWVDVLVFVVAAAVFIPSLWSHTAERLLYWVTAIAVIGLVLGTLRFPVPRSFRAGIAVTGVVYMACAVGLGLWTRHWIPALVLFIGGIPWLLWARATRVE